MNAIQDLIAIDAKTAWDRGWRIETTIPERGQFVHTFATKYGFGLVLVHPVDPDGLVAFWQREPVYCERINSGVTAALQVAHECVVADVRLGKIVVPYKEISDGI